MLRAWASRLIIGQWNYPTLIQKHTSCGCLFVNTKPCWQVKGQAEPSTAPPCLRSKTTSDKMRPEHPIMMGHNQTYSITWPGVEGTSQNGRNNRALGSVGHQWASLPLLFPLRLHLPFIDVPEQLLCPRLSESQSSGVPTQRLGKSQP